MFEYINSLLVIGQELQILIGKGQLELLDIHLDQFAFVQDLILDRKTWLANCDFEMYATTYMLRKVCAKLAAHRLQPVCEIIPCL